MKVSDLMSSPVITVRPGDSIAELLQIFKDRGVTGVPVVGTADRLVGIVSRQDIVLEELRLLDGRPGGATELDQILNGGFATVSADGLKSHSTPVEEIMTPAAKVLSCKRTTPITDACAVMARNHVHRLPVLAGRKLVGILTTFDVVRALADGRIGSS